MKHKHVLRMLAGIGLLLLIPLVAMQFNDEVNWTLTDFVTAGVLLAGTAVIYEFGVKRIRATNRRMIMGLVLLAALGLVWAELAVGLLGTPFAGS